MPPLFKKIIPGQSPVVNLNGAVRGSVRHPVPYQQSTDPEELLRLYKGGGYDKINRYLRSPDHESGINEILNTMDTDIRGDIASKQKAEQVVASIPYVNNALLEKGQLNEGYNQPIETLYRGMHFRNPEEYKRFVSENSAGQIVDYPAFTSTSSVPSMQEEFSTSHSGYANPVVMEIQKPSKGIWIDNIGESEYLYPPNSHFEIVSTEPIPGDFPGTKIIARETVAETPVEIRTSGIMGRLKGKAFVPEPAKQLLDDHLNRQPSSPPPEPEAGGALVFQPPQSYASPQESVVAASSLPNWVVPAAVGGVMATGAGLLAYNQYQKDKERR